MTSYDPNQQPEQPSQPNPYDQVPQNPYVQPAAEQSATNSAYGQPPVQPMQPMQPMPPAAYGQPAYSVNTGSEKNSLGNWALGLGIASIVCCNIFAGIPAIVVGILGIQAAGKGQASNKAMSIIGLVLGVFSILILIFEFSTGTFTDIMNGSSN